MRCANSPTRLSLDDSASHKRFAEKLNITKWQDEELVGCLRILGDGYFFATIPELMVAPELRRRGIGSKLQTLGLDANRPFAALHDRLVVADVRLRERPT